MREAILCYEGIDLYSNAAGEEGARWCLSRGLDDDVAGLWQSARWTGTINVQQDCNLKHRVVHRVRSLHAIPPRLVGPPYTLGKAPGLALHF